jgi:hypothetical protein
MWCNVKYRGMCAVLKIGSRSHSRGQSEQSIKTLFVESQTDCGYRQTILHSILWMSLANAARIQGGQQSVATVRILKISAVWCISGIE